MKYFKSITVKVKTTTIKQITLLGLFPSSLQQSSLWWPDLMVLFEFMTLSSLGVSFSHPGTEWYPQLLLLSVVIPHLTAVGLRLWKSSLLLFGPLRSDVLQTAKSIITAWIRLWHKPSCHEIWSQEYSKLLFWGVFSCCCCLCQISSSPHLK